ncbi:MAG: hypothetical protein ACKO6J_04810 [Crocinitomicaceae bacterium]
MTVAMQLEDSGPDSESNNTVEFWKNKYLNLLEKYNLLLEKNYK